MISYIDRKYKKHKRGNVIIFGLPMVGKDENCVNIRKILLKAVDVRREKNVRKARKISYLVTDRIFVVY